MFQVDMSDPTVKRLAEIIIQGFEDEIEGYLYSRFGD